MNPKNQNIFSSIEMKQSFDSSLQRSKPKAQITDWRQIQKQNFICIDKLAAFLELSEDNQKKIYKPAQFILNLPFRLAQKIQKNNLNDPIFRQFVPLNNEQTAADGFYPDPVSDLSFQKEKKILHKYNGRALWLTTSACAMHCRYCFRQNFPYESSKSPHEEELQYLSSHPDINEIILSGGDPLSLSNQSLNSLLQEFDRIKHIKRIRFHTRFLIGIPERIDPELLTILAKIQKQIIFVIHCNHPLEIDDDIISSIQQLKKLGILVLNQSVLLKGINDDPQVYLELCEKLVNIGVIPYYLHLLDKVKGAGHFEVSEEKGKEILQYVQKHTSGYAVPRLAREEKGFPSKTFLF